MKVKNAIELLNNLPLEAEICAQWYTKEAMEYYREQPLSDEVWSKALEIMDRWDEWSDLHESIQAAIAEAEESNE